VSRSVRKGSRKRKQLEEQFRLALEAAPTGMLMTDGAGTIMLVNAQIEKLFGYPRNELLGQRIEVLVPERFRNHHPGLREAFSRDPLARPMGEGRELYGLRRDGTEVPIEIGLNPLRTPDCEFVLSSVVDISHRQEIERMRRDFISTVSHELRTPLTSISGSLGLLCSGAVGVLPEKAASMVRIAHQNSERLARIINDILDIGKIDAGALDLRMVAVSLSDLVQQTVEANMGYAEKHQVRFLFDTTSASGRVTVDTDRLTQVLSNLLSNAAKFSPPGADVLIRVLAGPTTMRVEVEDSGPGIPEKFRSRVFEQFAQADHSASRRFEGTGLGLNIARKLLEAMGGTIGFSTALGQGTIFHFELPRIGDALRRELPAESALSDNGGDRALFTAAAATSTGTNSGVPRILHVEDDPDLISVIREALAGRADVVAAHSLKDAERLLCEGGFSLAVLDQSLPDGSGLELVDRIPGLVGHALPIIVLSTTDVSREVHAKVAAVVVKSQMSAVRIASTILSYLPRSSF
jgi:PAS domain S-box-containing protein